MKLFHIVIPTILALTFTCHCTSIIEKNDTALELLNNCKCVSRDFCYNGYVNIRGVGIITLRNNEKSQVESVATPDLQCSKPNFICCKELKDEFGNRIDNTLSSFRKEENTTPPTTEKQEKPQKENYKTDIKQHRKCGKPKPTINIRIYAGKDDVSTAMDGEFPWMASIHRKNMDGTFQFRCAGSLISESVVLTAAHCVYSSRKRATDLRVIANARIGMGKMGEKITEEREVNKILVHPEYYSAGAQNDIALIFLEKSFNESKELNSICLPDLNFSYDRKTCLAAGWGDQINSNGEKILSKVELPLVDHENCQRLLRKTRLGEDFELHPSSICAGGEKDKDTCKGDGGGPLICPNEEGYFIQVGIVSWGVDCSKKNQPGVYTNVDKFADWIQSSIRQIK